MRIVYVIDLKLSSGTDKMEFLVNFYALCDKLTPSD